MTVAFLNAALPNLLPATPTFANAVTNGIITIPGLVEPSGVAASRNNPNVLWMENDSKNPAVVYALDTQGRLLGTYTVPANTDNEDIGIGPGPIPNVSYLYVTDIGDNSSKRGSIAIYQAPEPAVYAAKQAANPVADVAMKGMRTITFTYPDGAHNAESEFIDPITGDWFVITKETTTAHIYTAPKALLDVSNNILLTYVAALTFDVPSGADISPLGNEIVVRQENFAHLWPRTNGQSVASAFTGAFTSIPVTGVAAGEPNGEAIGYDYYGGGYFTVSDSAPPQPLRYFARTSFDGPTTPRVLLPPAAVWKFLDDGSDQGASWREINFNDVAWRSGAAQLGYGDGDEQTTVGYGGNSSSKFITNYFRKSFVATNVNRIANLTLKLVVDDGANIFLNGSVIENLNLTSNATFTTAATAMPTAVRDTWQSFAVNPRLLVEGTNIIAVEVHLATPSSSSLSFDLQLLATEAPTITGILLQTNASKIFIAGSSNAPTNIQTTTNFWGWTNLGGVVLTNGSGTFSDPQATNFNRRFYRASRDLP